MKIKLSYPDLPALEIEGEPVECARLLQALAQKTSAADGDIDSGPRARSPEPARPEPKPSPSEPDPRSDAAPSVAAEKATMTAGDEEGEVRRYGGRPNRRHLVLECVRALLKMGYGEVTMAQIVAVFRDTYGPEHMHNLEQVVRDLANKTDKLERTEFGGFRLTESSARA